MDMTGFNSNVILLDEHERQRCEVWTRVMGYHRPVTSFNAGKQSEHAERKLFHEVAEGVGHEPVVAEACCA